MIAIRHDVLLAYLIEGDSDHARRAAALIEGEADAGRPIYVSHEALATVASTLIETCGRSHGEVDRVLRAVLTTPQLRVEDRDSAFDAVISWNGVQEATYRDWLAFHRAFRAGCSRVYTLNGELDCHWCTL